MMDPRRCHRMARMTVANISSLRSIAGSLRPPGTEDLASQPAKWRNTAEVTPGSQWRPMAATGIAPRSIQTVQGGQPPAQWAARETTGRGRQMAGIRTRAAVLSAAEAEEETLLVSGGRRWEGVIGSVSGDRTAICIARPLDPPIRRGTPGSTTDLRTRPRQCPRLRRTV